MIPYDDLWKGIESLFGLHALPLSFAKKYSEFDPETLETIIDNKDQFMFSALDATIKIDEEMNAISQDVDFTYRFKANKEIAKKFANLDMTKQLYNIFNDVLGFRFIIRTDPEGLLQAAQKFIDKCPSDNINCKLADQSDGKKNNDGYKGIHVYLRMKHNLSFPIEIQFWTREHALLNDYLHDDIYKGPDDEGLVQYAVSLREWLESVPKFPEDSGIKSYVDYLYERAYLTIDDETLN